MSATIIRGRRLWFLTVMMARLRLARFLLWLARVVDRSAEWLALLPR